MRERLAIKRIGTVRLIVASALFGVALLPLASAQRGSVSVDWKAELAKAKAAIEKNPKSAFWHNQAGVAYDAMGDFQSAVRELKLAATLDPSDPINEYALYAIYKRRGAKKEQRQALLHALEIDPNNPVGHFEFGFILEREKHWVNSLKEYQTAKALVGKVEGPAYVDPRGNSYDVGGVRQEVEKAIERLTQNNKSAQPQE
jgi:tetratricopeptide (TPR) repeat protein